MGRFETQLLATDANVEVLADMNGMWIDKVHNRHPPKMIILDMDSSVSPTHGIVRGRPGRGGTLRSFPSSNATNGYCGII